MKFSNKSKNLLNGAHTLLQELFNKAIESPPFDFSILSTYRNATEQNKLFYANKSQLKYPNSYHNKKPSWAIDIVPLPVDWKNIERFLVLSYHIKIQAYLLKVDLQWGGDWQIFKDYGHYQLKKI